MPRLNTKDRIMKAALRLFADHGYQKTSIARIETEAGLAPRAGAFYRHFDSKQALLLEVAREHIAETPEDFGLARLADFGDTRAELVAIALKYEEAMVRQRPYVRLIEEVRLLDFGAHFQDQLNTDMVTGLDGWIRGKRAAKDLSAGRRSALIISVIGGWLFYLSMVRQGATVEAIRDTLLDEWATRWASILDSA